MKVSRMYLSFRAHVAAIRNISESGPSREAGAAIVCGFRVLKESKPRIETLVNDENGDNQA